MAKQIIIRALCLKRFFQIISEKNKKAKEIEIKITFDIPKNYKDSGNTYGRKVGDNKEL